MLIKSSTVKKIALYSSYFLLFAFSMMGHIPGLGGYLNKLAQVSVVILFFLCLAQNRRLSKKVFIGLCVALLYSIVLIMQTGFTGMFKLLLLIAASRAIDFKEMLKFDAVCRVVLIAAVFGCCFIGIAPNVSAAYPDGTVRYSWGFQNSNHLGMALFILIVELLYIWDMKMTVRRTVSAIGILIFSEISSGSRTAELAGVLIIFCAILYTVNPSIWKHRLVKVFITYSAWIMAGITGIAAMQFEQRRLWANKINQLLSGRLANIQYFHQRFSVTLLGNDLSSGGRTLDTLYAYLWFGLGIVGFIIFCCAITAMIKSAYRKNALPFVIIMLCLCVYGLSERLWMYVDYNIVLVAFRELFFHDVFQKQIADR